MSMTDESNAQHITLLIVSGNPLYGYQVAHSLSLRYRRMLFIFDESHRGWRIDSALPGPYWRSFDGPPSAESGLFTTLQALARKYAPCVVIPADAAAMLAINAARAQLACALFPIPGSERVAQFDNKCAFVAYCVDIGIDVPAAMSLAHKGAQTFENLTAQLGLPFVVKPTNKTGGEGYRLIRSKADFEEGLQSDDHYAFAPLAAQEFIQGEDIDISVLAVSGEILNVTVQLNAEGTVTFISDETAVAMARKLVRASNYTGLLHLDGRRDRRDGRIRLVEANPRGWGSMKAATWCGLDFISAGVAVALGQRSTQPASIDAGSFPGFWRLLAELALGRRSWTGLKTCQRGLIRTRLTDLGYLCGRGLSVLQRAWRFVLPRPAPATKALP